MKVSPFAEGQGSSCDYCPYKAVCGFDVKIKGFQERKPEKINKKEIFERMKLENELKHEVDQGTAKCN